MQKTAGKKIKKARQEEARERLWENLTKGRFGIPSDWSILKKFCQHSRITDADEIYHMAAVRDLSTSNVVFKSVMNNKLDNSMVACPALEAIMKDQVEQLNTIGVAAMARRID